MRGLDIYIAGVGGQGIGMVSKVLARAAADAGHRTIGSDTHGLAQRGGTVISHLRMGKRVFGPLIPFGRADIVLALERLEGHRAVLEMLRAGGTAFCCDVVYQPISTRMGVAEYPAMQDLVDAATAKGARLFTVAVDTLPNPKLQNTALLAALIRSGILPLITAEHVIRALTAVLPKRLMDDNLRIFQTMLDS